MLLFAEGASSSSTPSKVARGGRKACSYRASCYRKNPQHRKDEAHPGDDDYMEDEDEDENAVRHTSTMGARG
jgi:hypothetical protein